MAVGGVLGVPPGAREVCPETVYSGHQDPDDKCRQEPSAAVSVTERSLSVGGQAWIGLLRLSVGRLAIYHSFPPPVAGPTRPQPPGVPRNPTSSGAFSRVTRWPASASSAPAPH